MKNKKQKEEKEQKKKNSGIKVLIYPTKWRA